MPLKSKLFTVPRSHPRLEACLNNDSSHIPQGSRGVHVELSQVAINRLNGDQLDRVLPLKVDGIYGPLTAAAVKRYKDAPSRKIWQSWQKSADTVVGKRTIESIDNELQIQENILPTYGGLIAFDHLGSPHDHSKCPIPKLDGEKGPDGRISHHSTPMNQQGWGRMVNIGGDKETGYLGFVDFVPDPKQDPEMLVGWVGGRPFTRSLPDHCCSDICLRSTPISKFMMRELKRIAAMGCRLTYASNVNTFFRLSDSSSTRTMLYLRTLGPIVEQGLVFNNMNQHPEAPEIDAMNVMVVQMVHVQ